MAVKIDDGWMRCVALSVLTIGALSCGVHEEGLEAPSEDASSFDLRVSADLGVPEVTTLPECENLEPNAAAPVLQCTGLYANLATKEIAPGVREYAPATPLWSDGAIKRRWIYLPPRTTIDASSRSDWVFPVGTKFWKEFSVGGKRIETRLFQKLRSDRWVTAAYAWSHDESAAISSEGGDFDRAGGVYHIPKQSECSDCHKGRADHILGFEEISLGTPGATGLTLAKLMEEKLLSPPPPAASLTIPDDGTGAAAPALAWLHVNCGVTCHNGVSQSTANGTGLRLRLDPASLASAKPGTWDPLRTSLGIGATTPRWNGELRIVPGAPERSLLVRLISSRGQEQMPPIATRIVDEPAAALIADWIRKLPHVEPPDAGPPDAGPPDSGSHDAMAPDAGDAGLVDVPGSNDAPIDDVSTDTLPPDDGSVDGGVEDGGSSDVLPPPDAPADDVAADAEPPDAGSSDSAPPDDAAPDEAVPGDVGDDVPPDGPAPRRRSR